jgi:hypothetical protein
MSMPGQGLTLHTVGKKRMLHIMQHFDVIYANMLRDEIRKYLTTFSQIYADLKGELVTVVICGGAGLNILEIIDRNTKDVDLVFPEHLPEKFEEASNMTAQYYGLKKGWINQGPLDLLRMGLPEGFFERCKPLDLEGQINWLITSRLDQIHFKLYASVDRGGYHLQDLRALQPTQDELVMAAQWCMTHDVSEVFKLITIDFLNVQGWNDAAQRIS